MLVPWLLWSIIFAATALTLWWVADRSHERWSGPLVGIADLLIAATVLAIFSRLGAGR
jgi:hypothetical protein